VAHSNSEDIQFHVSDDHRLYSVDRVAQTSTHTTNQVKILPHTPCIVSLNNYLTSTTRKLLDRKRIELAIKLACSMLQYNETPWFAYGWRKESIHFFEDPTTGAAINVDHPLILEVFPHAAASSVSSITKEPEDTLLDFAVLLMELYHRTTFEKWMGLQYPDVELVEVESSDMKLLFAMRWFKRDMPRNADFRGVVSVCLWPHPLQQYESSWEDEHFRCAFYEHVVAPLLEF
jgi:hypothetical protein